MKFFSILSVIILLLTGGPLWAQGESSETPVEIEAPVVPAEEEKEKTSQAPSSAGSGVEKIQVTGSHIKRIDVEGPSPVLTLDREYLDRSGYNSVSDVLRDTTVTATGVDRESSGSNESGSATAGLRGFGADKILVLLNGNRLPKIGGQNSVDLNLIPFQAIERVDILKDGASAVYGSDALAGVINFVTKKDYDGASISARYSLAEEAGGNRQDIAAVYGKNSSKGNFLAVYQYRNNQEVRDRDRDWAVPGLSTLGSPGSYRPGTDDGKYLAAPDCPEDRKLTSDGNEYCRYDFSTDKWLQPAIEQHSAVLSGTYDLNDSLGLYTTLTYTNRQSRWQFAPAPDVFQDDTNGGTSADPTAQDRRIPNNIATGPGWNLPNTGGNPIDVQYRLVDELGPRANRDTTDSYGGTVGIRGYLSDTWEWDQNLTYGASSIYNDGHSGYANKQLLSGQILDGSWRPFDQTGDKGNIDGSKHRSEQWTDSEIIMTQFTASGEVGNLWGGLITAAVGASGAWESFDQRVDSVTQAGNLFGGAGAAGQASRDFQAIFTEFGYSISDFEFQLAGRVDNFSDFGSTFNPKFGMRYTPAKQLMFRGSVGTGFKAPTLSELYSAQGFGFPAFVDQTACAAAGDPDDAVCKRQQYKVTSGGNPNLREETSFSYNLGTIIQPTSNWDISIDYWFTSIDDAIGGDLDNIMLAERNLGAAELARQGVIVRRDTTGSIIDVFAPNLNLSSQQADGLEFSTQYNIKLGALTIVPSVNHTHMLSYLEEPFPGLGLQSRLGEYGRPRWKNTSSLAFNFGSNSIRATGRSIAGQFKTAHTGNRADQRKLANYTEYDLSYVFRGGWGGRIDFGIKNVLGTDRPVDDTTGPQREVNPALYDNIGRLYFLGYTHDF